MITGTQLKEKLDKKRRWFLVLILVLIIVIIPGIVIYLVSRPEVMKVEILEGEGLEYKVVSESPESQWIIIETTYIPSESELKATAHKAWQENKEKENIFLYLPEMKTSGPAYGVAKFIPQGLKKLIINSSSIKGTKWE